MFCGHGVVDASAELTPQIGLLATLTELYVSFNKLKELPVELGRCTNLEVLKLGHNMIKRLPNEIAALDKLRCCHAFMFPPPFPHHLHLHLHLRAREVKWQYSRNFIHFSFHSLCCSSRSLDLTKNKLKLLPPDLGELHETLTELSISLNPCTHFHTMLLLLLLLLL